MPEIVTRVRWSDGAVERIYSPSLVVTDHLAEGGEYTVAEFVPLMRTALTEASDRVRAAYGFPCSRAAAALAAVERRAGVVGRSGTVVVEAFER